MYYYLDIIILVAAKEWATNAWANKCQESLGFKSSHRMPVLVEFYLLVRYANGHPIILKPKFFVSPILINDFVWQGTVSYPFSIYSNLCVDIGKFIYQG